jgi:hypothetical protein
LDGFDRRYSEKVKIFDLSQAIVVSILQNLTANTVINSPPVGSGEDSKFYAKKWLRSRARRIDTISVLLPFNSNHKIALFATNFEKSQQNHLNILKKIFSISIVPKTFCVI